MSLMTRKQAVDAPPASADTPPAGADTLPASLSRRARRAAEQAAPIAKQLAVQAAPIARQAVPKAKQAGAVALQGSQDAVAWAAPRVDDARSWAAPHLESAGIAVRETIAPKISDAMVSAAHKLDVTPEVTPKRRRWPKVLAGLALAAAATAAAAAVVRRRRSDPFAYEPPSPAAEADGVAAQAADTAHPNGEADGARAEVDANGQFLTS